MYFRDLTPYRYLTPKNKPLPMVQNVGWLAKRRRFPKDVVAPEVLAKLGLLFENDATRVNQTRGVHLCPWCKAIITLPNGSYLGSAEIWVPDPTNTIIYAAPTLIIHYIETHHYRPPADFLAAVENFDVAGAWDANAIYEDLLRQTDQS